MHVDDAAEQNNDKILVKEQKKIHFIINLQRRQIRTTNNIIRSDSLLQKLFVGS